MEFSNGVEGSPDNREKERGDKHYDISTGTSHPGSLLSMIPLHIRIPA